MDENTRNFNFLDDLFRSAEKGKTPLGRTAPFKFLDPYGPEDKRIYFGREFEVAEVYARFFKNRILVVYGESGSGKTSLVQCGLRSEIPTEDAAFLTIRSASDPLEVLERELAKYAGFGEDAPESLKEMLSEAIFRKGKPLALLFDQFEEFFLFQPPSVREAFVRELAILTEADLNIRVIFVIREEYLARMTELETVLPELLQNRIWVRRMSREQAKEVIVSPCRACDVGIEEGLADALLDDLTRSGGVELPILQVVMDSLYRRAIVNNPDSPSLTLSEYQEMGKVESILARFIEETVESHPQPERVRQVLKALITWEGTKRISSLDQIRENTAQFGEPIDTEELVPILRNLIDRRVLREDADSHLYELRHDALTLTIRQWMTGLEQELMEVRQTIENRHKEYKRRGTVLDTQTLSWIAPYESRLRLNPDMRFFVETSKRTAALRRRFLQVAVGAALGVFILVVSALGIMSYRKYLDSEYNMGLVFNEKAGQAYEAQDYNAARLYSLFALSKLGDRGGEEPRAIATKYYTSSPEYPIVFDVPAVKQLQKTADFDFSPDGKTLITCRYGDTDISVWDMKTGRLKATLSGSATLSFYTEYFKNRSLLFSPDGNRIVCYSMDNPVQLWDARTYKRLKDINIKVRGKANFSPDGRLLAFDFGGAVHIWDMRKNRETALFRGQKDHIYFSIPVFSPDGKTLAVCSSDTSVILWDVKTRKETARLTGHTSIPRDICFSPDGTTLASSDIRTLRIWNVTSKKLITELKGVFIDSEFSPDGKLLISGSSGDTKLWDTSTWHQMKVLSGRGGGKVKFSPDGAMAASVTNSPIELGQSFWLWDVSSASQLNSSIEHTAKISSLEFFPNGTHIVTAGTKYDFTIRLWEVKGGHRKIYKVNFNPSGACVFPDGNHIAVCGNDGIVQILDAMSGKTVRTFRVPPSGAKIVGLTLDKKSGKTIRTLHDVSSTVQSVRPSPDGELLALASADSTVRLWNIRTGDLRALQGHNGGVNGACFSTDGRILATCSDDKTIRLWDVRSGRQQRTITGSTGNILSIFFLRGDTTLVSISSDKTVSIWNVTTLERSYSFKEDQGGALRSAAFSLDGDLLALGLDTGKVTLWSIRDRIRIVALTYGNTAIPTALGFSPDGRLLAAGSEIGGIRIWDVSTNMRMTLVLHTDAGKIPVSFFSFDSSSLLVYPYSTDTFTLWNLLKGLRSAAIHYTGEYTYTEGSSPYQGPIRLVRRSRLQCSLSSENARLATVGMAGQVYVWDLWTGEKIFTSPEFAASDIDFSPDGSKMVYKGSKDWRSSVLVTRIWDVSSQRDLFTMPDRIGACWFSPDGSNMLGIGEDGWGRIFDMRNGQIVKSFKVLMPIKKGILSRDRTKVATLNSTQSVHMVNIWEAWTGCKLAVIYPNVSDVLSMKLSLDGSRFLVAGSEGLVNIFEVKTGKRISAFRVPDFDSNSIIALSPDGAWILTITNDQIIRFWNANNGNPVASIKGHSGLISSSAVDFSPDCSLLVTGDNSGVLHLWDMKSVSNLGSSPVRKLIEKAESQTRLTMRHILLDSDDSGTNLFGTPPNPPLWPERHPFHWVDQADKGDVNAMLKLGAIYEKSEEFEKARQWYQKAAQKGNAEGKKKLEMLKSRNTGR